MRVRAVLFDLDGVVRHWDGAWTARIEAAHGLAAGALLAAAFAPGRLEPALTGRVTDAEWRAGVADELATRYGPGGRAAVAEWSALPGRVDPRAVALVARIRARASVGLVSNATTRLERDLLDCGLDEVFPVVIGSAAVGAAKPDPAIYRAALGAVGVAAEDCAYVDDDPGHVEAAAALGLHAVRFTSVDDAEARLGALLGPPAGRPEEVEPED